MLVETQMTKTARRIKRKYKQPVFTTKIDLII